MELMCDGFVIRPWQSGDEYTFVKYANNRNVWINLRDSFPWPYTLDDARTWIEVARGMDTAFAIAVEAEAIGGISFQVQPDVHAISAELGYWLGEPFWGRGIATQAVRTIAGYAFAHHDIFRLFATVFEWNPASARVLEKAGFQYEGRLRKSVRKDGKIIDQLLYAKIKEIG